MAKYFLESSALAKRYHQEEGTDFVDSLFVGDDTLFYLNLAIIEVRKAFYRRRYHPQNIEGDIQITDGMFLQMQAHFTNDLHQMQRIAFTEEMIARAEMILRSYWLKSVFDLAQLSAFLITKEEYPDIIFVAADNSLITVARKFVSTEDALNPGEQ